MKIIFLLLHCPVKTIVAQSDICIGFLRIHVDFELEEELTNMIRVVLDRVFVEYEKINLVAPFSSQNSSGMEVDKTYSGGSEKGV